MAAIVPRLDRIFYRGYVAGWDDRECRDLLLSLMDSEDVVLDVGAGAGISAHTDFRGHVARVCGIDPDDRVLHNPHLDEARVGFADRIPYPDDNFDFAFAWNVVEHLESPDTVFAEVARVLKPGGRFVFKTPNRWHYVTLISRLLPHRFHHAIIGRIFRRTRADIFPTVYRCNSEPRIRRLAARSGFEVNEIRFLEPRPEYMRFSPLAYPFGIAYERIVNATGALRWFRVIMIVVLEKRGSAAAATVHADSVATRGLGAIPKLV